MLLQIRKVSAIWVAKRLKLEKLANIFRLFSPLTASPPNQQCPKPTFGLVDLWA
jgi:hypothetical protein